MTQGDDNSNGAKVTQSETLTAQLGKLHMIGSADIATTSAAQDKHLRAFEKGCEEWNMHKQVLQTPEEVEKMEAFVIALLDGRNFETEADYYKANRDTRREFHVQPSKPEIVKAYSRLRDAGIIERNMSFERLSTKKNVRSNSGVVVITVVTAPGTFSCPHDCHYCPNEPGQPRSYLSTEPAVARANQNDFCPVRQFYDRADTLAKQGHTVDKVEIIVLGGTWSGYPKDYQEEFCRDLFYAANTFDEDVSRLSTGGGVHGGDSSRERLSILEEQTLNEKSRVKIIGLTLETRPDYINRTELRRLRRFGCTRVQIGVQHTNDQILKQINRGHTRKQAVQAVKLLKENCFKVDIHLMPDLPGSDPDKDWEMFQDVLFGPDLQADHWKIYPCEVTPFTKIETWFQEGSYKPYTDTDPMLLQDLLVKVKAEVHPWIRLNRVIRDIPEVSIIAGNSNTNLRQNIFAKLHAMGKSCRCIRCREVRDWPETAEQLRVRIREYRSSFGTEYFITVEGGPRGLGGGSTQRGLAGGKKKTKKQKKKIAHDRKNGIEVVDEPTEDLDIENAALYGLLRLRFNDDREAPKTTFPELNRCALIRELHVYGVLIAARAGETAKVSVEGEDRPQHGGIGRTLMSTAERLAASHGFDRIAVISGVGVRNYYRKLGYELQEGEGQYLVKDLVPGSGRCTAQSLEMPFLDAAALSGAKPIAFQTPRLLWRKLKRKVAAQPQVAAIGAMAVILGLVAVGTRWRSSRQ
eukprot:gnl/MRDRNA2_/MRDRNA2_95088_c0_seq1.p1 gnl/MRDRNA2_/MRDRNA2_95088_c0~~gnl/MRDRNA2_/MRDRNA2_95088_c0_seq1.p1  ORF type:complete len:748 (+),score=151.51 gnl/MRDRNA2_/MRDRNA2_95088_c0_seq1:73-2316(+)